MNTTQKIIADPEQDQRKITVSDLENIPLGDLEQFINKKKGNRSTQVIADACEIIELLDRCSLTINNFRSNYPELFRVRLRSEFISDTKSSLQALIREQGSINHLNGDN